MNRIPGENLPPLPDELDAVRCMIRGEMDYSEAGDYYYTRQQMRDYARAALEAAMGVGQFRDADHLAEWLGSLVADCGQEEWDAAQAAMYGVRAFQSDSAVLQRLQDAIEGECEGLSITEHQANTILQYVLHPEDE